MSKVRLLSGSWLNPILVKEVRQGIKSKGFSFAFVLLQALMVTSLAIYLLSNSVRSSRSFAQGFFWFCVAVPLLIVMPIRAFSTIHDERKAKTLELVFLSRLTSWKIVFGKWLALMLQAALMVVATLPYLFFRYYVGSINVSDDFLMLLIIFGISAMLMAVGITFSPLQSRFLRGIILFGGVWGLFILPLSLIGAAASGSMSFSVLISDYESTVITALVWVFIVYFLLEFAASFIAPITENHAMRKRLIALVAFAVFGIIAAVLKEPAYIALSLFAFVPVWADSLCDQPVYLAGVYQKNGNRAAPFRFIGRFFYAGWPSGILYSWVTFLALLGILVGTEAFDNVDDSLLLLLGLFSTVIIPLPILLLIKPLREKLRPGYLGLQIFFGVVLTIVVFLKESRTIEDVGAWNWVPLVGLLFSLDGDGSDNNGYVLHMMVVSIIALVILLAFSVEPWKRIGALEKLAKASSSEQ